MILLSGFFAAEQVQHFLHAGGIRQPLNHALIIQRVGQAGDHLDMLVVARGDADHQAGHFILFLAEAHALRVLAEHHAGAQHRSLASMVPCGTAIDSPR